MYQSDIQHPSEQLQQKLYTLYTLNRDKKIDLSFRPPYLGLLEKLGNPHLKLPPVIHVAGTNGKGSIIAAMRSILEHAGYNVHVYTSPHLIRFNERILLAGKPIDDEPLEDLIDEVLELNGDGDLTFFEITTAIAFAAFSRTPADICLLEVGMGGRLDCTNVIEQPLAAIISAIGMDHAEHLGDTIEKIAAEKAGIIKAGAPCIISPQYDDSVHNVFENRAAELSCDLHNIKVGNEQHQTNLVGPHQQQNIATALSALNQIKDKFPVQDDHIKNGLKNIYWPARLQQLEAQHFGLDENFEVYLDGGHNAAAGQALSAQMEQWTDKPNILITGMMDGKDSHAFAAPIIKHCKAVYCVNIVDEPKSLTAEQLQSLIGSGECKHSFRDAITDGKKQFPDGARILIAGSLYLAGQVLADIAHL
ncbi:MAG: bifunctional folylpolyglutamate synthase/dihydrofolate synthase [Alphaproteobacteria bacterium]|nr:bifunctional folylpolyglutamate synthase/dihydrofolate synthase [Alphaproteobacteria bacterium]